MNGILSCVSLTTRGHLFRLVQWWKFSVNQASHFLALLFLKVPVVAQKLILGIKSHNEIL